VQFGAACAPDSPYPLGIAVGRFVALALHFRIRVGVARTSRRGARGTPTMGGTEPPGEAKGSRTEQLDLVGLA